MIARVVDYYFVLYGAFGNIIRLMRYETGFELFL